MLTSIRNAMLHISLLHIAVFCGIQALTHSEVPVTAPSPAESSDYELLGKHEDFLKCPKFSLDPDEYVMFPNATINVEIYNKTYTEEFYYRDGDRVMVCVPKNTELATFDETHTLNSNALQTMTAVGIGVSMVCLIVHLIVFALVPDLRNLPGCNMACMCASLFLSYLLMTVIELVHEDSVACVVVAGLLQFFLLASFLWMTVIAFDVLRLIHQATTNLRAASKDFKARKFLLNNLVAWGISLVFTAAAMITDNVDGVPMEFQPQFEVACWFNQKKALLAFFGGPAFTLFFTNFVLFGVSACKIFSNRMKPFPDSQYFNLKRSQVMYFRLAVITGVTWITGALAPLVNSIWLWYLFAALNAFQGFFIFVAFTCTRKVRRHFRNKLFGQRIAKENTEPTFQSGDSSDKIEKDLSKK